MCCNCNKFSNTYSWQNCGAYYNYGNECQKRSQCPYQKEEELEYSNCGGYTQNGWGKECKHDSRSQCFECICRCVPKQHKQDCEYKNNYNCRDNRKDFDNNRCCRIRFEGTIRFC